MLGGDCDESAMLASCAGEAVRQLQLRQSSLLGMELLILKLMSFKIQDKIQEIELNPQTRDCLRRSQRLEQTDLHCAGTKESACPTCCSCPPRSPHTPPCMGPRLCKLSKLGADRSGRQWPHRHGAAHAIACFWAGQVCGSSEEASQPRAFQAQQVAPCPQINQGCEHGFVEAAVLAGLHCLQPRRPVVRVRGGGSTRHR